ncbi:MAG: GAF domain-containing protein [Chloroflexi bacterium]|nr:GAF domain-containing protein [Chloroflexota bacterium]
MFSIKSLRAKTVLSALIPIVLMIVVVAIIALYAYERAASDVIQQRDTELARVSAAWLSDNLDQYRRTLQSIADGADAQSMDPPRLSSALEKAQNQLYVFDAGVVVYDSEGLALWSQPFAAERQGMAFPVASTFDKVRRTLGPAFSDVFRDTTSGEDVILVGVPIVSGGGEFKGVLAGMSEIKYPLLGSVYAEVFEFKVGRSGYAYLVDGNGRVIYHPDGSQVGRNLADFVPVVRATRGETGAVLTEDETGETVISSFAPVPGTDWGLITLERWQDVVGSIRGYSRLLLGLLVVGGILSSALIFFSIGRTLEPIKDLTLGAQRIARGDFDYAITANTGDEIQALAQQFNAMASALNESYRNLEQRVADRTQELLALYDVTTVASASLDLPTVLESSLDRILAVMGSGVGAIHLLDETKGVLHLTAWRGIPLDLVAKIDPVPVGSGLASWVIEHGEPLVVPDIATGPRPLLAIPTGGSRAYVGVPILARGQVLGVLSVVGERERQFKAEEVALLVSIASQVGVAMENAQLHEQAQQAAALRERQRLARDLHDAVTQTLFSAGLIAEVLPRLWERNPQEGRRQLEELRQLTRSAMAEMRTLLLELRPAALVGMQLGDLLRQLAEVTTGRARVPVMVTVEGPQSLPPDVQVALYRIAQEALNNVAKHAGASQATVSLCCQPGRGKLCISDDGQGFDLKAIPRESLGLGIMRERAEAVGATLTVESEIGRGTQVTVVWSETQRREPL